LGRKRKKKYATPRLGYKFELKGILEPKKREKNHSKKREKSYPKNSGLVGRGLVNLYKKKTDY